MTRSVTPSGDPRTSTPAQAKINDDGLKLPASWTGTFDVVFDGQRVWSIASKDRPVERGVRRFTWPDVLRPYLDGHARVVVREHVSGDVLTEKKVAFGSGRGAVRVVDSRGLPLAVTKWGRMNHPFETAGSAAAAAYLDQVEEVLAVLRDDCELPAFLTYGTLLGAVREGKLIGHDVDVDLAYLSTHEHPTDVIRESFHIERAFRRRHWTVRRENGGYLALFIKQPNGTTRNIDVFTCFYVEGLLHQAHDVRARLPRSTFLPLANIDLEGRQFPAPADPPALLEATYGRGWRTPDPSFSFKSPPATARRIRGWLGGLRDHRDYWNQFYNGNDSGDRPADPSAFAEWVDRREPDESRFVDIGCGAGKDTLRFAQSGRAALGLDYAQAGIRKGRAAAKRLSLPADFAVCNLYDLRHVLATGARLARYTGTTALYARFLVEALEQDGRQHLWRLAEMSLRGGGRLYLEFRALPEAGKPPIAGQQHRSHLLTPDAVAAEIQARGGQVEHLEAGYGLARCRDEDPYVCRLIANW